MAGDVSGKGVPAALLMAITITMIRTMSKDASDPGEILDRVNKGIAHDNGASMFVTIICGILNIKTGEILYSNGGHPLPLIIRSGEEVEFLKGDSDIVVGILETAVYRTNRIQLNSGDVLCLYTDGVTEAANKKDVLFDEGRLKEAVYEARRKTIKEIILSVYSRVNEFSEGAPQSDDITLLAVKYSGNSGK